MDETDYEEYALQAWNLIGNKRTRLYRAVLPVHDGLVDVPCNADQIEALTRDGEDYQYTTDLSVVNNWDSSIVENYIEHRKFNRNPLYAKGGYVKFHYDAERHQFQVDRRLHRVHLLYYGILVDDNGLPKITDKEAMAIAAYCAYWIQYKKGLTTQNGDLIKIAGILRADWEKKCDAARVVFKYGEKITQNEMDEILDAKSSWNRKMFNKSFDPLK